MSLNDRDYIRAAYRTRPQARRPFRTALFPENGASRFVYGLLCLVPLYFFVGFVIPRFLAEFPELPAHLSGGLRFLFSHWETNLRPKWVTIAGYSVAALAAGLWLWLLIKLCFNLAHAGRILTVACLIPVLGAAFHGFCLQNAVYRWASVAGGKADVEMVFQSQLARAQWSGSERSPEQREADAREIGDAVKGHFVRWVGLDTFAVFEWCLFLLFVPAAAGIGAMFGLAALYRPYEFS